MKLTRREVLGGAVLAAATGTVGRLGAQVSGLTGVVAGPEGERGTLVLLFLRGGADGLNVVVPWADDDYRRRRPNIGLPGPREAGAARSERVLDLDGFFGLHPSLAPILRLYQQGTLALVHAVGSQDRSRSHFEAMATVERGLATSTGAAGGWLARHLAATAGDGDSALRAVAFTDTMPESLSGAVGATLLSSVGDYRLAGGDRGSALQGTLAGLYGAVPSGGGTLGRAGRQTLAVLDAIRRLDVARYRPSGGAVYPDTDTGHGLRQAACLIKADLGVEVACLDMQGWDTHVAQGRDTGLMPSRLSDLGGSLAAFAADLGAHLGRVTTIAITEFGRRAYENSGLGTDHGRAGCMLLLGGGVVGGKVHGQWPGLADHQLEEPGDLRVTTDYRDVLGEVLSCRFGNRHLGTVFPGYTPRPVGIVREA